MVDSLAGLDVEKYLTERGTLAPKIVRQPSDVSIELGDSGALTVTASGYPLNFQWYKNSKPLPGAASSGLRIEKPTLNDDSTAYYVKVWNDKATLVSKNAMLQVKPYTGGVISFTPKAPDIDAVIDKIWENAESRSIDNLVLGSRDSSDDITGSFRLLWDSDFLYILTEVTDDVKRHTGEPGHNNDSIEIYIDYDNSKSDFYDDNDFQFRYEWSASKVTVPIGKSLENIPAAQTDTASGYIMEMALPWRSLGGEAPAGNYLGIELHINDNDTRLRQAKVAWHTRRDNSYRSPIYFGTMKLSQIKE
jgi:hypothetical protein